MNERLSPVPSQPPFSYSVAAVYPALSNASRQVSDKDRKVTQGDCRRHKVTEGVFHSVNPVSFVNFRPLDRAFPLLLRLA